MSDLRQDPVSGDWIIMAPERAKRLNEKKVKNKRKHDLISKCPFEHLKKNRKLASYFGLF